MEFYYQIFVGTLLVIIPLPMLSLALLQDMDIIFSDFGEVVEFSFSAKYVKYFTLSHHSPYSQILETEAATVKQICARHC